MTSALLRLAITAGLLVPATAEANAGVPMLALAWPLQWLALVPIVLLEAHSIRRAVGGRYAPLVWPVARANLVSTLVGVPIAWALMLVPLLVAGLGMSALPENVDVPPVLGWLLFPLSAAWVMGESPWQVYAAFLVLTIPFCWISTLIERRLIAGSRPDLGRDSLDPAVLRANVLSYGFLAIASLAFPLSA